MATQKKRMHLATAKAKATAARAKRGKGEVSTNDCVKTYHDENTNDAGGIQAPATQAVTDTNTHSANTHGHSTIAVISKSPSGDADEIPTHSPFKRRNGGSLSHTNQGRKPPPRPVEECYATASELS